MKARRSRFEIYVEILRATQIHSKPTRIMYATNTSWVILKDALFKLAENGYVKRIEQPNSRDTRTRYIYEVTERGINVVNEYDRLDLVKLGL